MIRMITPARTTFLLALLFGLIMATMVEAQRPRGRKGRGERKKSSSLKVGQPAPDFELKSLDGKKTVKLSDHKGKRPVVLIFGSYT